MSNLQTQISGYCKMTHVLEMIQTAQGRIAASSVYVDNHKRYMMPVVDYHLRQVARYKRIHDRLVKYANSLSNRLYHTGLLGYETEEMMNALPF